MVIFHCYVSLPEGSHRFINLLEFADALRLGTFPGLPSGPEETGAPMAHGHHKQKHFHEPQIRR